MAAKTLAAFVLGLVVGVLLPAITVYGYFRFGYAPVATSAPEMPFEKTAARLALRARLTKEAPAESPIPADGQNLLAGAGVYRDNCAVCHGQPGRASSAIAAGMYPQPPQLFVHSVTDDPVGVTYWKVANGIRMTGMPGFRASLSDRQLWQVSVMLASADKLPDPVNGVLRGPIALHPAPGGANEDARNGVIPPHAHEHGNR
jgi:thiosulfate dehydrogenase